MRDVASGDGRVLELEDSPLGLLGADQLGRPQGAWSQIFPVPDVGYRLGLRLDLRAAPHGALVLIRPEGSDAELLQLLRKLIQFLSRRDNVRTC